MHNATLLYFLTGIPSDSALQYYSTTYNTDAVNLCSEKLVKGNLGKSRESSFTVDI